MITSWAHLLNAKHIDQILSHIKTNTDRWYVARITKDLSNNVARGAARSVARDAISDMAASGARLSAARNAISDVATWCVAICDAAYYAARHTAWDAARNAVYCDAWDTAYDAAHDAILALVAYDDCAYLLNEKPEDVKMMALLGNQKAILLYPACVALSKF